MTYYFLFKSDIPDMPTDDSVPGGLVHLTLLMEQLAKISHVSTEPWNEEGCGWECLCELNRITVGLMVQENWHEDGAGDAGYWQAILHPVVFFGFLRRKMIQTAVAAAADVLEKFLTADDRFSHVRRLTSAQHAGYIALMAEWERTRRPL